MGLRLGNRPCQKTSHPPPRIRSLIIESQRYPCLWHNCSSCYRPSPPVANGTGKKVKTLLISDFVLNAHFMGCLSFKAKPKLAVMETWKARKPVSLLSAQPTEILGTKLKLPRQRALGLAGCSPRWVFLFRFRRFTHRRIWSRSRALGSPCGRSEEDKFKCQMFFMAPKP